MQRIESKSLRNDVRNEGMTNKVTHTRTHACTWPLSSYEGYISPLIGSFEPSVLYLDDSLELYNENGLH